MSARNYMPFIEGAMEHIQRIYEFNHKIDEMRLEPNKPIITTHDNGLKTVDTLAGYISIEGMYACKAYRFNDGLRMYYEERHEYTTALLASDPLEAVDAIVDQFIVAIGEIRKCALADDYDKIDFWENKAQNAYWELGTHISNLTIDQFNRENKDGYSREAHKISESRTEQALTAVIDALFTRFGDDAYIDENGKFIKSKGYTKPDLSFLLK